MNNFFLDEYRDDSEIVHISYFFMIPQNYHIDAEVQAAYGR